MSRAEPGEPAREGGRDRPFDDDRPPSWMGAPGYTPYPDDLPAHAPMPGAPPYPPAPAHPPAEVGRPRPRTGFGRSTAAAAVWAGVNLLLVLVVNGLPPDGYALGRVVGGLLVPTLLAGLATWLVARRRGWSFPLLVLLAAPFFWVPRAVLAAAAGA
ncbi:MAG TPA: hypothetical protein VD813_04250 [Pseudonocardia sp.]|nr:hypothetical protein [Pseudonocardia sp.]